MKTYNKIIVMAAAVTFAVMVANVQAQSYSGVGDDGVSASPKFREQMKQFKTVSGTTVDAIDRSAQSASPKALALANSFKTSGGSSADTVIRTPMAMSPKVHETLIENGQHPQIAPLK